ncbi:MAG: poly-beta-hydroxybutyrate polymerase [Tepidiforma sp.]|nr:alpha/beta fold hydrolase [Tepidiforma sp.]GIW19092.1 MAG: poly-beta-hydroxybutyrate polymerase [Tepidiforma sp.]
MTAPAGDASLEARVRMEVERAIQRSIKGLEYISTGDPAVGLTPKDVIHSRGTLKLYHYRPQSDEVYRVPVMLVMSLVSKPYILDLAPGQSLVEFLVKRGFDVYMIDWGVPRPEDARLRLEDYVLDFIPDCVERVLEDSGEREISLVGYCMGGQLSTMYAALHTGGPLKNLACFTTPVDSDGMVLFKRWLDPRYFDVDRVVDTLGNVPPELIYASFDMLKPAQRVAKNIQLWDNLWNDDFVRSYRLFERWAADQIPFPGECFRQFTKQFMWENRMVRNELEVGGRRVDLGAIRVPFLHVVAEHDHIVPYDSARPLVPLIGSEDKREVMLKGGHVSLVAGGNAIYRLWPQLESWLAERSV